MSTAAIVVITIVITLATVGAGMAVLKARKNGLEAPWDKIRPILAEVFMEVVKIREADAMGYGKLEDYAVNFVKSKVDSSEFLTQTEKDLLTTSLIRAFIAPTLEELYKKKG